MVPAPEFIRTINPVPFIFAFVLFCLFCWGYGAYADTDWIYGEDSLSHMGISDVAATNMCFHVSVFFGGVFLLITSLTCFVR